MSDQAVPPDGDDPALAALRQVADTATTSSLKRTVNAYLLVRAVRRGSDPPPSRRPRVAVPSAAVIVTASVAVYHWHAWSLLLHFVH